MGCCHRSCGGSVRKVGKLQDRESVCAVSPGSGSHLLLATIAKCSFIAAAKVKDARGVVDDGFEFAGDNTASCQYLLCFLTASNAMRVGVRP
eukprot:3018488-Amphidinium_carterae.2